VAVLDASAVIALARGEPGSASVTGYVHGGRISSVNYSEVLASLAREGLPMDVADAVVDALQLEVVPFTADQARTAAKLRVVTASFGLSLGDRACLAVAMDLDEPAVTADRAWAELDVDAEIVVVR